MPREYRALEASGFGDYVCKNNEVDVARIRPARPERFVVVRGRQLAEEQSVAKKSEPRRRRLLFHFRGRHCAEDGECRSQRSRIDIS